MTAAPSLITEPLPVEGLALLARRTCRRLGRRPSRGYAV